MPTPWNATDLDLPMLGRREIVADRQGGTLLPRTTAPLTAIIGQFANGVTAHRPADLIEPTPLRSWSPSVSMPWHRARKISTYDHDDLRGDPRLATGGGKTDPTGENRQRQRDRGKPLAGKSTLNRLELTPTGADATAAPSRSPATPTTARHSS